MLSSQTAPTVAEVRAPSTSDGGRSMTRAMRWLLVSYLALIVLIMVVAKISMTPDLFVLWGLVVAVILGRGLAFLRDWLPLVAIFVAWESARGLSQHLAARVQSDSVIMAERLFFFGIVPTEELQRLWHDPARLTALDLLMSAVYLAHFILPLGIGFLLWLRNRGLFFRYMTCLMVVSFAAFFTAIVLPVAPPRFSAQYGEALAVRDVMADTFAHLGSAPSSWLYGNINGNPVAAFPSLHAAYPLLAYLFVRSHRPSWAWPVLLYTLVVWFAIVYLGHHYVVDIFGGIAYAVVAYWLVSRSAGWDMARLDPRRWLRLRRPVVVPE